MPRISNFASTFTKYNVAKSGAGFLIQYPDGILHLSVKGDTEKCIVKKGEFRSLWGFWIHQEVAFGWKYHRRSRHYASPTAVPALPWCPDGLTCASVQFFWVSQALKYKMILETMRLPFKQPESECDMCGNSRSRRPETTHGYKAVAADQQSLAEDKAKLV
ncbi:hypothetical protein PoB_001573800 [Plakobranchus ocellatus]|uniref:Uncharacterized protein n=1 Tax=Plakobranchus ocellatus TaxID=259542 RepID=A0AAV3Z3P7_9GAST|nr:hypothetical protein PoB_001573800 [Plakobranchus ocellatus]